MMERPIRGDIRRCPHNTTLHGRSKYRKEDVPGHNVVKGYSTPGKGDALDIFVLAGTPVFAMHDGIITRIADRDGRLGVVYIENTDKKLVTVYAHLHVKEHLKVGQKVLAGYCIGFVNRKLKKPHLHLEVWIDNKAISASKPSILADKIASHLQSS